MNTVMIVRVLKALVRFLPYVIGALTGTGVTMAVSGCKVGSLISIVP